MQNKQKIESLNRMGHHMTVHFIAAYYAERSRLEIGHCCTAHKLMLTFLFQL